MPYVFNKITVRPQLPKRINRNRGNFIQFMVVMEYGIFAVV